MEYFPLRERKSTVTNHHKLGCWQPDMTGFVQSDNQTRTERELSQLRTLIFCAHRNWLLIELFNLVIYSKGKSVVHWGSLLVPKAYQEFSRTADVRIFSCRIFWQSEQPGKVGKTFLHSFDWKWDGRFVKFFSFWGYFAQRTLYQWPSLLWRSRRPTSQVGLRLSISFTSGNHLVVEICRKYFELPCWQLFHNTENCSSWSDLLWRPCSHRWLWRDITQMETLVANSSVHTVQQQ